MGEPLKPNTKILSRLGSLFIHVEEGLAQGGHPFDMLAIGTIIDDPEVKQWIKEMDKLALIPKKR